MSNVNFVKTRDAQGAVAGRRIVKHGTADHTVAQATASTEAFAGVSERFDVGTGDRVDVIKGGIAEVVYGGAVTRGDPLTADAQGRAVKAAPAAGVNAQIIGFAEVSGVAGDFGLVEIVRGTLQG